MKPASPRQLELFEVLDGPEYIYQPRETELPASKEAVKPAITPVVFTNHFSLTVSEDTIHEVHTAQG